MATDPLTARLTFHTELTGYSCEFSPFNGELLAVSTAQNFGIIGTGRQYVLRVTGSGIVPVAQFDTRDGCYDCTWSEVRQGQLCFAGGDGGVRLWDFAENRLLREWREHTAECYSVDWNLVNKENIISGSWDNSIKLWHPDELHSLRTYSEHQKTIYTTVWHPRQADTFLSTSGDGTVKIW